MSALALILASGLVRAEDNCDTPGERTLCSAVCPNQGSCNNCCQTQFNHATESWWSFIQTIKRIVHMSELHSCQNNCASDLDRLGQDVPSPADDRPETTTLRTGVRVNSGLTIVSRLTFSPAGGGVGVDYHLAMRDGRNVEMIVTTAGQGTSSQGRCEIVGFGEQRLTMLVSESAPMVRLETTNSSVIIVDDGRFIDQTNRKAFESVVRRFDARFLGQLRAIAASRGADDPAVDAVATVLNELLDPAIR